MQVRHRHVVMAWVLLGTAPLVAQEPARGAESATLAVEGFLRAASDSNLTRMAELFGTDRGSAARTGNPADYPQRMVIMQAALAGTAVRANAETATDDRNRKVVTTEIARGNCKVVIPVRAVRAREGWLVLGFDLPTVWEGVNKPCEATGRSGNSQD